MECQKGVGRDIQFILPCVREALNLSRKKKIILVRIVKPHCAIDISANKIFIPTCTCMHSKVHSSIVTDLESAYRSCMSFDSILVVLRVDADPSNIENQEKIQALTVCDELSMKSRLDLQPTTIRIRW